MDKFLDVLAGNGLTGVLTGALLFGVWYLLTQNTSAQKSEIDWHRSELGVQRAAFIQALKDQSAEHKESLGQLAKELQQGIEAICERLQEMEGRLPPGGGPAPRK